MKLRVEEISIPGTDDKLIIELDEENRFQNGTFRGEKVHIKYKEKNPIIDLEKTVKAIASHPPLRPPLEPPRGRGVAEEAKEIRFTHHDPIWLDCIPFIPPDGGGDGYWCIGPGLGRKSC